MSDSIMSEGITLHRGNDYITIHVNDRNEVIISMPSCDHLTMSIDEWSRFMERVNGSTWNVRYYLEKLKSETKTEEVK